MADSQVIQEISRRNLLRRLSLLGGAAVLSPWTPGRAQGAEPTSSLSLAGAQPGIYRFRIGAFEALALGDGQMSMPLADNLFTGVKPSEQIAACLREALLPEDKVTLAVNVLLVKTPSDLILVDTGCGAAYGSIGGRLLDQMTSAGVDPDRVTVVVLTHLHGDHYEGLLTGEGGAPVFKNARLVLGRREHEYWMGNPDLSATRLPSATQKRFVQRAQEVVNRYKGRWELVAPDDRLMDGVEFVEAAGHTPGHLLVAFQSGGDRLVNFADTAHHHALSFRYPDWPMIFDADRVQAAETRRRLLDRFAQERVRLFGVHMPFPGLGRVRALAQGFDYVPEPWSGVPGGT